MHEQMSPEQFRQELIAYYEDKIARVEPSYQGLHQLRDEVLSDQYLAEEDKSHLKQKLIRTWFSLFGVQNTRRVIGGDVSFVDF